MASKFNDTLHSCEVCGIDSLSDEELREHMVASHVEGNACCPFCDLTNVTGEEMVLHVNAAHLDYLTPLNEAMKKPFIVTNGFGDNVMLDSPNVEGKDPVARSHPISFDVPVITIDEEDNQNGNTCKLQKEDELQAKNDSSRLDLSLNLEPSFGSQSNENELGSNVNKVTRCPICNQEEQSPVQLEQHINLVHFDGNSPSCPIINPEETIKYSCPFCLKHFDASGDLELHVNIAHKDILSPSKPSNFTAAGGDNDVCVCPVCSRSGFPSSTELALHIDTHFGNKPSIVSSKDVRCSGSAFAEPSAKKSHVEKMREEQEFSLLKAQYGMDGEGNFSEQSITSMQRAVYSGKMSVSDYYERKIELKVAERNGLDDGRSCTKGLLNHLQKASASSYNVKKVWLCSSVDHYASTYGDKGWGCGYRNIQMLLSSLQHHTEYYSRVFSGPDRIPSISQIQKLIENAWKEGFDAPGCEQLGGRLLNTRKWIGSTEVVTLLSSFRIKCQLIDFHRPTGSDGTHPELFRWCLDYFKKPSEFKPPLYLQHQGHSRTVIGVEEIGGCAQGIRLLVFDPSHSPTQMSANSSKPQSVLRLIRKPVNSMKAKQYQMVAVVGLISSEQEYQASKVYRSVRIPND